MLKNLGLKRSKLEIISDILTVAKKGWIGITEIIYGANLNFRWGKPYIKFLLRKNFLKALETERGIRFKTTERGFELLKDYQKFCDG